MGGKQGLEDGVERAPAFSRRKADQLGKNQYLEKGETKKEVFKKSLVPASGGEFPNPPWLSRARIHFNRVC